MKVSALLLSPLKRGGSLPIALMFAAAAIAWAAAPPVAAGPRSQRWSSGSSSSFSHCDIQEFFKFCFSKGVLWGDGSSCRCLRYGLGGGHAGASDTL